MLTGKRVLYICADPGVPVYGKKGCSIHVQEVIRELVKLGAKVDLVCQRNGGVKSDDLKHVTTHLLPKLSSKVGADREQQLIERNRTILSVIKDFKKPDLVYERYSLWSYSAMEWSNERGIKSILEVNAPLVEEQKAHRILTHEETAQAIAMRVFKAASTLVAVSDEIADYLKSQPGLEQKTHVVPNGVRVERFTRKNKRLSSSEFTIGFVGTLKPWHGITDLIKAFALLAKDLPCARLLIVGDGPERESLNQLIKKKGLTSLVEFTGAVEPEQIAAQLARMDVAVAPYPLLDHFYFSPLKVYEYMAAHVPVVAGRVGQLIKLIEHGSNGLLNLPGNSLDIAKQIRKVHDFPELRAKLSANAYEMIVRQHTWQIAVKKILMLPQSSVRPSGGSYLNGIKTRTKTCATGYFSVPAFRIT